MSPAGTGVADSSVLATAMLPVKIESLNKFKGAHWASRTTLSHWRRREMWSLLLRSTDGLGMPIPHGLQKRRVVIKRLLGHGERAYDDENILGGDVKALCDALRDLSWLKDDSPQWRDLVLLQLRPSDERVSAEERAAFQRDGVVTIIQIERLS